MIPLFNLRQLKPLLQSGGMVLVFMLVMTLLFRQEVFSQFNLLPLDRFDGLIEVSLVTHWYNVLAGHSHWDTVGYFYPFLGTLGYNDGYFLYGIIASFYRVLGFDILMSVDLVNVTLKALGYFSFYYLCKNCLNLNFFFALLGAILFTLGNSLVIQTGHAQLLSIALSPLLVILLFRYGQNLLNGHQEVKAIFWGSSSGILIAIWLISTYYMAWFFLFFGLITSVIVFILLRREKDHFHFILSHFKVTTLVIPAIVTLIALIPFLTVYLSVAHKTGMHSVGEIRYYAPKLGHLIDPTSTNLLFGRMSDWLFSTFYPSLQREGEFQVGFPPIMLIMSLLACYHFWKRPQYTIESILLRSVSLAIFVSILLMLKVGGFTLWKLVWYIVPGAKGLRVVSRYALFLIFPITLISVYYLAKVSRPKYFYFILVLSVFLILEQINFAKLPSLNRGKELAFLNSVAKPPGNCEAFYVTGQRSSEILKANDNLMQSLYPHNVDAMLLAEFFGLRTLNGFSTFNPPGWNFALVPQQTYRQRVKDYVDHHNIRNGLCEYDLLNRVWKLPVD